VGWGGGGVGWGGVGGVEPRGTSQGLVERPEASWSVTRPRIIPNLISPF
jgi:hypothetical protein